MTTVLDDHLRKTHNWYRYLNQGDIWVPKRPAEPIAIADMNPEWRFNSAMMLLRQADRHADAYGWGELFSLAGAPDDVQDDSFRWAAERERNPRAWMQTTSLYRALVADLPGTRTRLTLVADRARHWGQCAGRAGQGDCTCDAGPAVSGDVLAELLTLVKEMRRKRREAAAAARETQRRADEAAARWAWMGANPGLDPDTGRLWGVDEDGVNHGEAHGTNGHCQFDSCRNCGGYHCGWHCPDSAGGAA